jgi:uncharacterized protein
VSAVFAVLRIDLHFPEAASLKAKRAELAPVKAALRQRFGAALAEVDHQDIWQRATLLAAVCAGSERAAGEHVDSIERWLDARFEQGARIERRIASWGDMESIG